MSTWIVRANPSRFRIHDFIRDYGFVEYLQKKNFQIGDIVFLYITAPYKRVEYKMFVEEIDIIPEEEFDDRSYSLINKSTTTSDSDRVVRFRNIAHIETDELCYKKLLEHGFKYTMQSDRPVKNETEAYIESFFK